MITVPPERKLWRRRVAKPIAEIMGRPDKPGDDDQENGLATALSVPAGP
jgi:hypothetical protein